MKNFWVPSLMALIGVVIGFFAGGHHRHLALFGEPAVFLNNNYTVSGCAAIPANIVIQVPPASTTDLTQIVCANDNLEWKDSTPNFGLSFDSASCVGTQQVSSTNGDIKETAQNTSKYALQVCKYNILENGVVKYDPHIIIMGGK